MADTHELHAHKLFNVDKWVCVVTGGGTGIGLMCAQALAANGAKVYITSRNSEKLEKVAETQAPSGNGTLIPLQCDVTSKSSLEELVTQIEAKEFQIDLLVNNAGISGPKAEPTFSTNAITLKEHLWENETPQGWHDVFQTNVTAVYFTTVAFLPLLQKAKGPSVINISSMSGLTKKSQGHFSYNAAKAATVHLTKMLSAEFVGLGIRVNSIAPGYFPSQMTAKSPAHPETGKSSIDDSKFWDEKGVPAGRAGADEEMAQACLFLARSAYVNGEILAIDGGALLTMGSR